MTALLLMMFLAATQESDLVKAANEAKAARTGTKPKVITNATVKKAKSKLSSTKTEETPAAATKAVVKLTPDEHYHARRDATEKLVANEKKVATLEKELDLVEQSFYDSNDPSYRDDVIQKRFEQTKRQLDEARKELANARDALAALSPKS